MDGYEIGMFLIKAVLVLLVVALMYTFFKYPKDIIVSLTRGILGALIPFWSFDNDDDDDKIYPSKRKIKIRFDDYEKFIIVISSDKKLVQSILTTANEIDNSIHPNEFLWKYDGATIHIKVPHIDFHNYHVLLQLIQNEFAKSNEVIGLLINRTDAASSYFVVNDATGNYINSLVGRTNDGAAFSIYLLHGKSELRVNNSIKNIPNIDLKTLSRDLVSFHFSKEPGASAQGMERA